MRLDFSFFSLSTSPFRLHFIFTFISSIRQEGRFLYGSPLLKGVWRFEILAWRHELLLLLLLLLNLFKHSEKVSQVLQEIASTSNIDFHDLVQQADSLVVLNNKTLQLFLKVLANLASLVFYERLSRILQNLLLLLLKHSSHSGKSKSRSSLQPFQKVIPVSFPRFTNFLTYLDLYRAYDNFLDTMPSRFNYFQLEVIAIFPPHLPTSLSVNLKFVFTLGE